MDFKKVFYRFLQNRKEKSLFYTGTHKLSNRKYLTKSGIKKSTDLNTKDKYELNIKI